MLVIRPSSICTPDGDVPEGLKGKRLISLDIASMLAGAKYRGEFEERIKRIIEEAQIVPSIILVIDEIHTLVGAGAAEGAGLGLRFLKHLTRTKYILHLIDVLPIDGSDPVENYQKIEMRIKKSFLSLLRLLTIEKRLN